MKTFIALFLSCAALHGADIANTNAPEITTKIFESQREGGKVRLRAETTYRDGKPILRVLHTTKSGVVTTSRSYLISDDLLMIELDEGGDGFFEKFYLFRPGTKDLEMFTREVDGSVKPVSSRTLKATQKQLATVDEVVDNFFQKERLNDEELEILIQETQEKIKDAEKDKVNDEK